MAGLADFSVDEIISSDDTNPNVTLAGPGTLPMSTAANAGDVDTSGNESPQISGELPLDSAVIENAMAAQTKGPAKAEPVVEVEKPAAPAKRSQAQDRIVALIAERNQARDEAARISSQVAAIQQQMAEQNAWYQQEQLRIEQRRLEMQEKSRAAEEDSKLSEVDRARSRFLAEAESRAEAKLAPKLAELEAWKTAMEAEKVAAKQAAEEGQRLNYFKAQANNVLDSVLLKDYTPEEQKALRNGMEEMLYSFSGAFGVDPVRAAPVFKDFLSRYNKAEMSKLSRLSGTKVAESRQASKVIPASRPSGRPAGSAPTLAQLRKGTADGRSFDNHVQWYAARQPALMP